MSKSNKITLIGNVGQAPELKVLSSGAELVKFSFATANNFKDKSGEWQKQTSWHNCVVWNATASKIMQNATKGSYMMIEGELTYNEWEDKHGQKRRDAEVKVNEVYFLNKPTKSEDFNSVPSNVATPDAGGDLPF
jgi:single-strand DNA-binding protein